VDGVRHTAKNIVVATGSDAVIPPIPGLRDLQGIWTNREATGMKAVPRRLLDDGSEQRGDPLLVATGRRPRVDGIGLETVGIQPDPHGLPVDAHLRFGEGLWGVG